MRWPLAEALLAFEARRRREDIAQLQFEQLLYSIGGGKKPKTPRSLEEFDEDPTGPQ